MTLRRPEIHRTLGVVLGALGMLGLVVSLSNVSVTPAAKADGIDIAVPITAPSTTPTPLIETPVTVPVGTSVADATFEIALTGLDPFSLVEVYANSEPVLIAVGFADGNGEFSAVVNLPPNLAPGDHSITAKAISADGTTTTITVVEFAVLVSGKLAKPGATASGNAAPEGVVDESSVTEDVAEEFLSTNPLNLSGVFYVGGFQSYAVYDDGGVLNPGARISMYINNVYSREASGTVRFWLTNPLGLVVAESEPYSILPLAPGETRLVTSRFNEIGQWGGYTTHLSFTPDEKVSAGIDTPYLRSDTLLVFSWVLASGLVLGIGGAFAARIPAVRARILGFMSARSGMGA